MASDIRARKELWVRHYQEPPEINPPIKLEVGFSFVISSNSSKVGIEDCLHIEFEFNQQKFHLEDAIVGKVFIGIFPS